MAYFYRYKGTHRSQELLWPMQKSVFVVVWENLLEVAVAEFCYYNAIPMSGWDPGIRQAYFSSNFYQEVFSPYQHTLN